jgi:hypothetical protein
VNGGWLKLVVLLFMLGFGFVGVLSAQSPEDVYNAISEVPGRIHWCLPGAGDDPAGIIESRCRIYSNCLASARLTVAVDEAPFPTLSDDLRESVRRCHQALFNAAATNPQLKGSKATQEWLQHRVIRGTEAKSFPVPAAMGFLHCRPELSFDAQFPMVVWAHAAEPLIRNSSKDTMKRWWCSHASTLR